jgi:hypothetical protein
MYRKITMYIYVVGEKDHPERPVKIGMSKTPKLRLQNLQGANSSLLEMKFLLMAGPFTRQIEKDVKNKLAQHRASGGTEFFKAPLDDVIKQIKKSAEEICSAKYECNVVQLEGWQQSTCNETPKKPIRISSNTHADKEFTNIHPDKITAQLTSGRLDLWLTAIVTLMQAVNNGQDVGTFDIPCPPLGMKKASRAWTYMTTRKQLKFGINENLETALALLRPPPRFDTACHATPHA